MKGQIVLWGICVLFLTIPGVYADVPDEITYQGRLLSAGSPETGPTEVRFSLWTAETGGSEVWSELHSITPNNDGIYTVVLGSNSAVPDTYENLWIELAVEGTTLAPRKKLTSAPYALNAGTLPSLNVTGNVGIGTTNPQVALDVNGGIRAGSSGSVSTCGSGQANGEGSQRYNYTTHQMEYCNGTGWVSVSSSAQSVSAKYGQSYSQTIVNGPTTNILNCNTKNYDSNNAVTTGSNWVFTVPVSGVYRVTSTVVTAAYNWGNASHSIWLWAVRNGSWETFMGGGFQVTTVVTGGTVNGSATLNCAAGDTLAVGIVIWRGANTNMLGDANQTWVSIERVADAP